MLAAGAAHRFGANKQLADLDGEPLVRRAARLAQQVCGHRSLLVTGYDAAATRAAAGNYCALHVVNDRHAEGLASSLRAAIEALEARADALLILLGDQIKITPQHLEKIMDSWSGAGNEIVASGYAGVRGAPMLLPRASYGPLLQQTGDRGASRLLGDERFTVRCISFEDAAIDIDTPGDLAAARQDGS